MIRVGCIVNGSSKLSAEAHKALELIGESSLIQHEIVYTTKAREAITIAKRLSNEKQVIVAVGGDGTCHETLNGWHQTNNENCAFGLIPSGTGNDFSRMLPAFNPLHFVQDLEQLRIQLIDYGLAFYQSGEKAFLNISDLGFGAKVVEIMERQRSKGIRGKASYSLAILRTFLSYRKREVELKWNGKNFKGKILLAAFCNGQQFGHGLTIYPFGSLNTGKLGITIVGDVSLATYVSKLPDLKKARPIKHRQLTYDAASSIEFVQIPDDFHMEFDGEICRERIKKIQVLPSRLPLIDGSR